MVTSARGGGRMSRLYNILNALAGLGYKETTQTVTANLSAVSSAAPLSSFGYIEISRPSGVPANAIAELQSTNGWGWLVKMSGTGYRFLAMANSGSRTFTVVWRYRI